MNHTIVSFDILGPLMSDTRLYIHYIAVKATPMSHNHANTYIESAMT